MPSNDGQEADDVRKQFQEALQRKQAREQAGRSGSGKASGKPHDVYGPAKTQRTFRRKSG